MRTILSNMTERDDHYSLETFAREKLLHLVCIIIADPAGAQTSFGGSQTEVLGSYCHVNISP